MLKVKDILEAIQKISPEGLQESWDNSGFQVNLGKERTVKKVLTCLEINDAVIDEAVNISADMIITHHPLIFGKLNKIDVEDIIGNQIIRLVSSGITVYSAHTSFDSALMGTNQHLAEAIGLQTVIPMVPSIEYQGCGMGRIGVYDTAKLFPEFIQIVESVCGRSDVRVAGKIPTMVKKVAICTGSGSEFIDQAFEMEADVFITGDLKYHDARHAYDIGMCVVDAGHFGTEVIFADNIAAQLSALFRDTLEIVVSETDINPFVTF